MTRRKRQPEFPAYKQLAFWFIRQFAKGKSIEEWRSPNGRWYVKLIPKDAQEGTT